MNILAVIFVLSIVITIHELGHAIMSAIWGLPIKKIHIGWPVWPLKEFKVRGMPVTISPWLLGAALQIDETHLDSLHFIKRITIFLAGPFANITAFIASAVLMAGPKHGFQFVYEFLAINLEMLKGLFNGQMFREIIGPIGIVDTGSQLLNEEGILGLIVLWFAFNVGLALFNLLPIPPLDGGKTFFAFLSGLFGDTPKSKMVINVISGLLSFVVLFGIIFITLRDIFNLFR